MSGSEAISLISLVIAIQGAILFIYNKGIRKLIYDQRRAFDHASLNSKHIAFFHETLLVTLQEVTATNRLYGSLISRIATNIELEIASKIPKEIGHYDNSFQKSLHELCLFSSDASRRNSSIRALAEDYGDLDTLDLMNACRDEYLKSEDSSIQSGIDDLKIRLRESLVEKAVI